MFAKSPAGTTETYDYVRLGDCETGEWFAVQFEHIVKLEDGQPIPFVEEMRTKKTKKTAPKRRKKDYPDRVIEWGQWLRYDLKDGTTVVRPHSSVDERYANTDFEAKLATEKTLKKRWLKHSGWAVRPKFGDVNTLIFVSSVKQAEDYPMPFQPQFAVDEDSEEDVIFESYF
tara:strand:- start:461 stop:976 length:516 start_codon:yes stop_codon:yes gene_type:complete